jgi:hypothetical protein
LSICTHAKYFIVYPLFFWYYYGQIFFYKEITYIARLFCIFFFNFYDVNIFKFFNEPPEKNKIKNNNKIKFGAASGNTCLFLTIRCLSVINKLREIAPNAQSWSHTLKRQFTLLNIVCFLIRLVSGDKDPLHLKWNGESPFHDLN